MAPTGYESPTAVDAPLEYITVESYEWPKPARTTRARLDERERRRRHCACQQRFLARKHREFQQLHQHVARLELQLKLATAWLETKELETEHDQLQTHVDMGDTHGWVKQEACLDPVAANVDVEWLVVQALDVDALVAELGLPM